MENLNFFFFAEKYKNFLDLFYIHIIQKFIIYSSSLLYFIFYYFIIFQKKNVKYFVYNIYFSYMFVYV